MSTVDIQGVTALVTGANRGIGKALVRELIDQGAAKVYATARSVDKLGDLVATASEKIIPLELDVTNEEQIKAAAEAAGDVLIVINNAGIAGYSAIIAAQDTSSARQEMEVNYFGVLHMVRAFAPILKQNKGGVFVNISSIGGLVGIPMVGTYCATKAAVHSLTQSIRGELAGQETLVIGVYPGSIDTDMAVGMDMEKESPYVVAQAILDAVENGIESVYPDKVADAIGYLIHTPLKKLELQWSDALPQAGE